MNDWDTWEGWKGRKWLWLMMSLGILCCAWNLNLRRTVEKLRGNQELIKRGGKWKLWRWDKGISPLVQRKKTGVTLPLLWAHKGCRWEGWAAVFHLYKWKEMHSNHKRFGPDIRKNFPSLNWLGIIRGFRLPLKKSFKPMFRILK